MPKPPGTEHITTYVDKEVKQKLRVLAAQQEQSVAQLVAGLIETYVKRKAPK